MDVKRGSVDSGTSRCFSRKGQVTIFIIIGIILLFAFAGILYVTQRTAKSTIETQAETAITSVPETFRPVQTYTENCLRSTLKEGLLILGQQGGYIYPELTGEFSLATPTDSSGLDLESVKVPYWHFNAQPNEGNTITFSSFQPKLLAADETSTSIEAQLARYVQEKMDGCLQDYGPFEQQGIRVSVEGKEATVSVTDDAVRVQLEMPLTARKGDAQQSFDRFSARLPLNLKHYYELASAVADAERNYGFLESQTLGLMATYSSATDRHKLPPTDGATFDLVSTTFWHQKEVKEKLISLLTSYVPLLQVLSARNLQYYEYPVADLSKVVQQQYDEMVIPITGAEDVAVRFDYFGWEPYFDVNDEDGIIKPQEVFMESQFNGLFPAMGIQRYYIVYDLSYPVLVTIDDPLALDGEGYQFLIALEANIRNNKRAEADQVIPVLPPLAEESLACNKNQRTELLKTVVVDSYTKEPLEAVRVGFTIPDVDECTIGVTDETGELAEKYPAVYGGVANFIKEDYLTAFYPVDTVQKNTADSENAIIGYASAQEQPVIELHRFKAVNLSVQKVGIGKCVVPLECQYTLGGVLIALPIPYKDIDCKEGRQHCFFDVGLLDMPKRVRRYEARGSLSKYNDWYFLPQNRKPLSEKEEVFVTLTKVDDVQGRFTDEYGTIVSLKGNEKQEVTLVPGKYKVDATLIRKEPVIFPKDERSSHFDVLTWETETQFTINQTVVSDYIAGSIAWDVPPTYLTITPEQLYSSKELTLYIPAQDMWNIPAQIPSVQKKCGALICVPGAGCAGDVCDDEKVNVNGRVIEDMQLISYLGNVSRDMRRQLEPRWG